MTGQEMVDHFDLLMKEKLNTISKKNNDYAKNDDAFSNFKYCADFAGIRVEQVFMVFMAVKMARLQELMNGKDVMNEGIKDTLLDLSNYSDIFNIYLCAKNAHTAELKTGTSEPQMVTHHGHYE